jgi:hypothetical protein
VQVFEAAEGEGGKVGDGLEAAAEFVEVVGAHGDSSVTVAMSSPQSGQPTGV